MARPFKAQVRFVLYRLESVGDALCGRDNNPFYHLGALAWFFFWIVTATGLYLFIPYETSVAHAWESIQHITIHQWYLGGLMRSLHRYASDAMVLVTMIHLLREFALERYHGARWFAWITGVPTLWMLYTSGITGYWLVWDMLAQYLAVGTSEWLDWLGIFGESIARNFLTRGSLTDRFFTLLIFIHIAVPLFMLFGMWIHILRVNQPGVNPPRTLAIGTLAMLVALSLVYPATSHEPADLGRAAAVLNPDWFFVALYPIFDTWGPGPMWGVAIGITVGLGVIPWLGRRRRPQPAVVDLENCSGCTHCSNDCPFGAVIMAPRSDGRVHAKEAVVSPDICTGCGICVGSCPTATPFRRGEPLTPGIDLPESPVTVWRRQVQEQTAALQGSARILLVGCDHGVQVAALAAQTTGIAALSLPCTGALPPSFIDWAFSHGWVDGVVLTGCRPGECYHRLGPRWTFDRVAGMRPPVLKKRVQRERMRIFWAAPTEQAHLAAQIAAFRADLPGQAHASSSIPSLTPSPEDNAP